MRPMNPDFVEFLEERGISIVDWTAATIAEKGTIIQAYEQGTFYCLHLISRYPATLNDSTSTMRDCFFTGFNSCSISRYRLFPQLDEN